MPNEWGRWARNERRVGFVHNQALYEWDNKQETEEIEDGMAVRAYGLKLIVQFGGVSFA